MNDLGDTINRLDPNIHFGLFGMKFEWKNLIMVVVEIAVCMRVDIFTGGTSLAIQAAWLLQQVLSSTWHPV